MHSGLERTNLVEVNEDPKDQKGLPVSHRSWTCSTPTGTERSRTRKSRTLRASSANSIRTVMDRSPRMNLGHRQVNVASPVDRADPVDPIGQNRNSSTASTRTRTAGSMLPNAKRLWRHSAINNPTAVLDDVARLATNPPSRPDHRSLPMTSNPSPARHSTTEASCARCSWNSKMTTGKRKWPPSRTPISKSPQWSRSMANAIPASGSTSAACRPSETSQQATNGR